MLAKTGAQFSDASLGRVRTPSFDGSPRQASQGLTILLVLQQSLAANGLAAIARPSPAAVYDAPSAEHFFHSR